ncbi:N-ethylmaleimide reductase [Phlyctochytrium arcticum]|nr:N-ethylmaleimide reductase [Phlyctochytrium arcticum]
MASPTPLFTAFKLTPSLPLAHRIVLAPLTRSRSSPTHVPQPRMTTYYADRATKGGLLITEATAVSASGYGYPETPGIYTDEMVEGWSDVAKAVHGKGGFIFTQLWHVGRISHPDYQAGGALPISSSAVAPKDTTIYTPSFAPVHPPAPHSLNIPEIQSVLVDFEHAAANALKAGLDGVEIHGANGYLVEQFLSDGVNQRTDSYGGSVENRARFALEVVQAAIKGVGGDASKVGIRLSPWGTFNDIKTSDTEALMSYLLPRLDVLGLAYIHFIEPRFATIPSTASASPLSQLRPLIKQTPVILAGGYESNTATEAIDAGLGDLVAFGRRFLSNPDFVERVRNDWELNPYDRDTFYIPGDKGYNDYPFYTKKASA